MYRRCGIIKKKNLINIIKKIKNILFKRETYSHW